MGGHAALAGRVAMSSLLSTTLPHRTVALFGLWLLLSESYNLPHMAIGLLAAFGVALLNTHRLAPPEYKINWPRAFAYVPWLFGRILLSGVRLSYLILHPRLPIAPKLFRHRTQLVAEQAVVVLGNSITLTPGTITVEANADEFVVHAMDHDSAQDVTTFRLDRKIATLFERRKARR